MKLKLVAVLGIASATVFPSLSHAQIPPAQVIVQKFGASTSLLVIGGGNSTDVTFTQDGDTITATAVANGQTFTGSAQKSGDCSKAATSKLFIGTMLFGAAGQSNSITNLTDCATVSNAFSGFTTFRLGAGDDVVYGSREGNDISLGGGDDIGFTNFSYAASTIDAGDGKDVVYARSYDTVANAETVIKR